MDKASKKLSEKKAAVVHDNKRRRTPMVISVAVCLSVLIAGAWLYVRNGFNARNVAADFSSQAETIVRQITYPISMFDDGKAAHFEYADQGVAIKYFILKSSDGTIRAAFDACDVCWSAGKGYYQEGDDMVCRNCGRRFPSLSINEVQGGCNPAPLVRKISGDSVVIRVEDILDGKRYFDFSKL